MEMESKKLWVLEEEDRTARMETKLKDNIKENFTVRKYVYQMFPYQYKQPQWEINRLER